MSVSATPGKTKHFQTIHLSASTVLCDCPGLVFPQFATTAAELVCDGVLPIDQLREYTGPASLVVKRVPREVLEGMYGLSIRTKSVEEGGDGKVTAEGLLIAYAGLFKLCLLWLMRQLTLRFTSTVARGFARSGQGNPDEARAARYILKDYVNAKLLYSHPPPDADADEFDRETVALNVRRLARRKRAPVTRVGKNADTFINTGTVEPTRSSASLDTPSDPSAVSQPPVVRSTKARAVDESFFASTSTLSARPFVQGTARHGQSFSRSTTLPHQNAVADDGTPLDGRRARVAAVLAANGANGLEAAGRGKKHFKANKKVKQRSGRGYDDD